MINAKEAKALYDKSGHEVANFIKNKVEPVVIKAATDGKRKVFIQLGATQFEFEMRVKITSVNQGVVEALKELGYVVSIEQDGASYVPRGMADDEGDGPEYTNYGFHIGW
jgi:hypothetical protein